MAGRRFWSTLAARREARGAWRAGAALAALSLLVILAAPAASALAGSAQRPAQPEVLLVGLPGTEINGVAPEYHSIQQAVCAAKPGARILIAPGDYKERGYADGVAGDAACKGYNPPMGNFSPKPAGVLIETPGIWLIGLGTASDPVVIDGTKPGSPMCSSESSDQVFTPTGLNGVEVYDASGTWLENLWVCNYLTNTNAEGGDEIWWNGGEGTGATGIHSFYGEYLLATSTYSSGVNPPRGEYGIYADNVNNSADPAVPNLIEHSFASNMGDAAFYIGGCPDCDTVIDHGDGRHSALGYSGTNSGGDLTIEHTLFADNKTGFTSNSQNNSDLPSPQIGLCPGGEKPRDGQPGPFPNGSCTVLEKSVLRDNNDPNVPGGGGSGLASGAPVGTGAVLAGTEGYTLYDDTIVDNGAWGAVVTDLPDQEQPPSNAAVPCQGGLAYLPVPPDPGDDTCYYEAFDNELLDNHFSGNGTFGNPTNGDILLSTAPHDPGNCVAGNSDPGGLTTDPPQLQGALAPLYGSCEKPNGGDLAGGYAELGCATQLVFPCPSLGVPGTLYPRPSSSTSTALFDPPPWQAYPVAVARAVMPDPCKGVPADPWCPASH